MSDPNYHRFRVPRIWSNEELRKFGGMFTGDVVNVSGWKDEDKEGKHYKDYFANAKSYSITNFKSEARGFQGQLNEVFLDLTAELPPQLDSKYDLVFNHTTLEHIFEVEKAFHNICKMSRDVVILVVPFLQEMHADYGDFWRFTPLVLKKMFDREGLYTHYLSFNNEPNTSVYVFVIASKNPEKWKKQIPDQLKLGLSHTNKPEDLIGYNAITLPVQPKGGLFTRIRKSIKKRLK